MIGGEMENFLFHIPAVLGVCWHSAGHTGKLTIATNVKNESKYHYSHPYMLMEWQRGMRSEVRDRIQCTSNYSH
jgi:hypothetical protein